MSDKILEATYMPDEMVSYVVKSNRWGTFADIAKCSDEDAEIASDFAGCNFAEYKCDIQAQHEKAKYYKARFDGVEMVYNNLKQSIETSDPTMISLYRQRNVAYRDYKKEVEKYKRLKQNYKAYTEAIIKSRKSILKKITESEEAN